MAKPAAPRASSSVPTAAGRSSAPPAARSSSRKKTAAAGTSMVNDASVVDSAPAAPLPKQGAFASEPSHEQIAARAYGLWLSRSAHEGDACGDWLRAEHELRTQN